MSMLGPIGNLISRPDFSPGFVKVMSEVGRPGWKAIIPLETAVIAGRSGNEARRSGWLGFQERFIEEIVVAAVWLWGVKTIGGFFDKFHKFDTAVDWSLKKAQNVDLTAMERYTRNASDGRKLLGMKGARLGFSVVTTLLLLGVVIPWLNQMKTKWIIDKFFHKKPEHPPAHLPNPAHSVNTPQVNKPQAPAMQPVLPTRNNTAPVPFTVPNTPPAEASVGAPVIANNSPSVGPNPRPNAYTPSYQTNAPNQFTNQAAHQFANPAAYPTYPYGMPNMATPYPGFPTMNPVAPWAAASMTASPYGQAPMPPLQWMSPMPPMGGPQQGYARPLQFAGLGGAAGQTLSKVGHWIENTDYGSILVTDAGIMAGRCTVAARRSPFESLEIMFRDGLSLYFYVLCVPHLTGLLNKAINPALQASIKMDPFAAEKMNELIMARATKMADKVTGKLSLTQMQQLVNGSPTLQKIFERLSDNRLQEPLAQLVTQLRTAPLEKAGEGFLPLLEKEARVYFNNTDRGTALLAEVKKSLAGLPQAADRIHADQIGELIQAIESRDGAFKALDLTMEEQGNMVRSIKQAFRHTAGLTETEIRNLEPLKALMTTLASEERVPLKGRMKAMAQHDGMDLMNSMFRRSIHVASGSICESSPKAKGLLKEAELLSGWLERSASRMVPLETIVNDEIESVLTELNGKLPTLQLAEEKALEQIKSVLTQKTLPANAENFKAVQEFLGKSGKESLETLAHRLRLLEYIFIQEKPFKDAIHSPINRLMSALTDAAPHGHARPLLSHYQQTMTQLLEKEGKIFSLSTGTEPKVLMEKMEALFMGGLQRDASVLRESMRITKSLAEDAKLFDHPEKTKEMQHAIEDYLQTFLRYLEKKEPEAIKSGGWTMDALQGVAQKYFKLSRNSRVLVQFIAIPAAMIGLGLMVPKLQFWLTRTLTGKDQHPGIAAVSHGSDAEAKPTSNPMMLSAASALDRNNFQAFRRQAS